MSPSTLLRVNYSNPVEECHSRNLGTGSEHVEGWFDKLTITR